MAIFHKTPHWFCKSIKSLQTCSLFSMKQINNCREKSSSAQLFIQPYKALVFLTKTSFVWSHNLAEFSQIYFLPHYLSSMENESIHDAWNCETSSNNGTHTCEKLQERWALFYKLNLHCMQQCKYKFKTLLAFFFSCYFAESWEMQMFWTSKFKWGGQHVLINIRGNIFKPILILKNKIQKPCPFSHSLMWSSQCEKGFIEPMSMQEEKEGKERKEFALIGDRS